MWNWALYFLFLLGSTKSQDVNCDYQTNVTVGRSYYVYNREYPSNYTGGVQCRWIAVSPPGYNVRLECTEINLPYTQGCTLDKLLISKTGDAQLAGAESYCGRGSLTVKSIAQKLSIGLITSTRSPGGNFICTVTATPAAPSTSCDCGYKKTNRIVGGQETEINEYPMMVGMVDLGLLFIKCGGVCISANGVLTAAHCIFGRRPSEFGVVVGEHDVNTGDSPATKLYKISSFSIHPNYDSSNYDYDIAVVNMATPIQFSALVGPVCLPFKFLNTDFTGKKVTALGWGTLFPGGPDSNVLREVDLDVVSQTTCRQQIPKLTPRQMCTFTRGKDSCQDDSGGPLLYTDPATGRLFCVALVSAGTFCASQTPSINTRVMPMLDFILSVAPENYCMK